MSASLQALCDAHDQALRGRVVTEPWRFSLHGGHRPTFGDDSHSAEAVGTGLELARAHLLRHDLREVTTL